MSSAPDTHGVAGEPWIGFDLDGTLAIYDKWEGIDHIGAPIAPMVELAKRLHADGKKVKIVTARVAPRDNPEIRTVVPHDVPGYAANVTRAPDNPEPLAGIYAYTTWTAWHFIADWCAQHLGFVPEIVYQKDHLMVTLYDDRVKQVIQNDGTLVADLARDAFQSLKKTESDLGWALARANTKFINFTSGLMLGCLIAVLTLFGFEGIKAWRQRDNAVYQRADEVRISVGRLLEVLPAAWTTNVTETAAQ